MNELQYFNSPEFGQVRTVTINDEPYFVGKDVALALGYTNHSDAIDTHVDKEDKLQIAKRDLQEYTDIGTKGAQVINESGLYALIFGSKLESAKRFKKWVTGEVLPAIRKTGTYQKPLTALEQLNLHNQAILEVNEKVDDVKQELEELKNDMPVLGIDLDRIKYARNQKVVPLLGGKSSNAYKDDSLRKRVYSDNATQVWREYGIKSFKELKRSQVDDAIDLIKKYELPFVLAEEIKNANAQINLM